MTPLLIFAAVVLILARIIQVSNRPSPPVGHWHHHFDNLNYSSLDFYKLISEQVKAKEIPGVEFKLISYKEHGMFSMNREYLRITRNYFVFDICAAPFAKGFFVSWWLAKMPTFREMMIYFIPILSRTRLRNAREQTYFEMDTETMFKDSIHKSVLEAIDMMTNAQGIRLLEKDERLIPEESML